MNLGSPITVLVELLIDTDREIDGVLAILGFIRAPDFDVAEIEAHLLSEGGLFRCSRCRQWLSTRRIDPEKEEWCYGCALEWREAQAAQDAIDEENNRVYGEDGKELEE